MSNSEGAAPRSRTQGEASRGSSTSRGAGRGERFVMEAARAGMELGLLGASLPLLPFLPRGEPHPVIVVPGMFGSDESTVILRRFLRTLGYTADGWGQGMNRGPQATDLAALARLAGDLAADTGRRVSLVGWSMGGVYALATASRRSADVRQVVTLGSPISAMGPDAQAVTLRRADRSTIPVTSVYSRSDSVVPWESARLVPGDDRENVEVGASHLGLGHHPSVLAVVADRLAQPEGAWRPLDKDRYRALLARGA